MNKDLVLDIKDLTFFYKKDNLIYNDFSLELKKGELVTIFGKSGSGKTTLFELILGTLKPISGTINKSNISMIFQDPSCQITRWELCSSRSARRSGRATT